MKIKTSMQTIATNTIQILIDDDIYIITKLPDKKGFDIMKVGIDSEIIVVPESSNRLKVR